MRHLLIGLALALLGGCAQNPVTGQSNFVMMSENQEIAIGRQYHEEVIGKEYRVYESKALQDYVNHIGQKLARNSHRPNLQYHFSVLDSPEINAFALPGGYVYVTRGIMAYLNSEAELAGVIGHEIGHVTARHGVRQQSAAQAANIGLAVASIFVPELNTGIAQNLANILGGALLSGYGREHELEADRLGAQYLAHSDYDPQAIISVLRVLKNQELKDAELAKQEGREPRRYSGLFDTHPDNDTRLQQVVGEADKLVSAKPIEGRSEFLAAIDGLVFNDNADQGVVRNNGFYHGELGIALQFPEAWRVHNQPDALIAVSPGGDAMLQMKMDAKPRGAPVEYARRLAGSGANIRHLDLNGLSAATFELPNATGGVVYHGGRAYVLQAQAKARGGLDAHREAIFATVRSFHALAADERKLVKPLRLRVATARQGDTYARLAQNSPLGKSAESYLRLINAQYPDGEPRAGQRIKLVE
ncbi:MAG: peptidase M48 Ste24p [Gallionellales bacterium RIFCSPLOWO2_12_FULL_59_22]|nr:MAG: peptidase M48 Ste24p [Gallionellales bacterium RIFCSPLOWO2_02_58_13]OGT13200.1 MAG: peptidase M48 Ste24p [Gallionellales bacterium RIFCSPLOWO2_12_FULL_59_22]